jgi:hypothetical protein
MPVAMDLPTSPIRGQKVRNSLFQLGQLSGVRGLRAVAFRVGFKDVVELIEDL